MTVIWISKCRKCVRIAVVIVAIVTEYPIKVLLVVVVIVIVMVVTLTIFIVVRIAVTVIIVVVIVMYIVSSTCTKSEVLALLKVFDKMAASMVPVKVFFAAYRASRWELGFDPFDLVQRWVDQMTWLAHFEVTFHFVCPPEDFGGGIYLVVAVTAHIEVLWPDDAFVPHPIIDPFEATATAEGTLEPARWVFTSLGRSTMFVVLVIHELANTLLHRCLRDCQLML